MGRSEPEIVYVALGSNLGDREANIDRALSFIEKNKALRTAIAGQERLLAESPNTTELDRRLSISAYRLGQLLTVAGRYDEAREAFKESFAIAKDILSRHPGQGWDARILAWVLALPTRPC